MSEFYKIMAQSFTELSDIVSTTNNYYLAALKREQELIEQLVKERIRCAERCADICRYGDIEEYPLPADIDTSDPEVRIRELCALAILATLEEVGNG